MEISIADIILLIAALAIAIILYTLNGAIRLLNNRVNIISHTQTNMLHEMQAKLNAQIDNSATKREAELRARLDRDFR